MPEQATHLMRGNTDDAFVLAAVGFPSSVDQLVSMIQTLDLQEDRENGTLISWEKVYCIVIKVGNWPDLAIWHLVDLASKTAW